MGGAARKGRRVTLIADLIAFLSVDQQIKEPEELANAMAPLDFPAKFLAETATAGRGDAFSALLQFWLTFGAGIRPPKGVFACDVLSPGVGRPRERLAKRVYEEWHRMSKPTFWSVARKVLPDDFKTDPKKAADRVRQLYLSFEQLKKRCDALLNTEDKV